MEVDLHRIAKNNKLYEDLFIVLDEGEDVSIRPIDNSSFTVIFNKAPSTNFNERFSKLYVAYRINFGYANNKTTVSMLIDKDARPMLLQY